MHYKKLNKSHNDIKQGDTFVFEGKTYEKKEAQNSNYGHTCKGCAFMPNGQVCPPIGCSGSIFIEHKPEPKPKPYNRAYIIFDKGDHIYTATCLTQQSLIGYLTEDTNTLRAVGVEFHGRSSKYFIQSIKRILKMSGLTQGKRVEIMTWDTRVKATEDLQNIINTHRRK